MKRTYMLLALAALLFLLMWRRDRDSSGDPAAARPTDRLAGTRLPAVSGKSRETGAPEPLPTVASDAAGLSVAPAWDRAKTLQFLVRFSRAGGDPDRIEALLAEAAAHRSELLEPLRLLAKDEHIECAMALLGDLHDEDSIPLLLSLKGERSALYALGGMGGEKAKAALSGLLSSPDAWKAQLRSPGEDFDSMGCLGVFADALEKSGCKGGDLTALERSFLSGDPAEVSVSAVLLSRIRPEAFQRLLSSRLCLEAPGSSLRQALISALLGVSPSLEAFRSRCLELGVDPREAASLSPYVLGWQLEREGEEWILVGHVPFDPYSRRGNFRKRDIIESLRKGLPKEFPEEAMQHPGQSVGEQASRAGQDLGTFLRAASAIPDKGERIRAWSAYAQGRQGAMKREEVEALRYEADPGIREAVLNELFMAESGPGLLEAFGPSPRERAEYVFLHQQSWNHGKTSWALEAWAPLRGKAAELLPEDLRAEALDFLVTRGEAEDRSDFDRLLSLQDQESRQRYEEQWKSWHP